MQGSQQVRSEDRTFARSINHTVGIASRPPGRPISQYARDGIDRSYVNRARHAPTNTDLGGLEEQISDEISRRVLSGDQGMVVWWSIRAGVHVEPHSHANKQIVWMLKGKLEFRLGSEQRVCGQGDVVVIPGGMEHEAWFRED